MGWQGRKAEHVHYDKLTLCCRWAPRRPWYTKTLSAVSTSGLLGSSVVALRWVYSTDCGDKYHTNSDLTSKNIKYIYISRVRYALSCFYKQMIHYEWFPTYPPVSQSCMELLQWSFTKSQDFLSCWSVAEQVLQVDQRQLWFGLHGLLDTHLSIGVRLVLKLEGSFRLNLYIFINLTSVSYIHVQVRALRCCVYWPLALAEPLRANQWRVPGCRQPGPSCRCSLTAGCTVRAQLLVPISSVWTGRRSWRHESEMKEAG